MVHTVLEEDVAQGLVDKYRRIERPKKTEGIHLREVATIHVHVYIHHLLLENCTLRILHFNIVFARIPCYFYFWIIITIHDTSSYLN